MSNEDDGIRITIENADESFYKELADFLDALESDEVSDVLVKHLASPSKGTYCVRCQSGHQEEFKSCNMAWAAVRAAAICGGPFSLHKGSCPS
jgi:hypothetical protein